MMSVARDPAHADPNPSRILGVGDTHGNAKWWLDHVLPLAKRYHAEGIVQVGDFGVRTDWSGNRYLDVVNQALEYNGLWCWFVDGNHENFDALLKLPLRADGLREVRPRILHLPRGHRWMWQGVQFLALGGAVSPGAEKLTEFRTWWSQERITSDEVTISSAGGTCDVLFAHDVPDGVPLEPLSDGADSVANRRALRSVVNATEPRLLCHGHVHHAYRALLESTGTLVVGLDMAEWAGNCVLLDVARLAQSGVAANDCVRAVDGGPTVPRARDLDRRISVAACLG
jgi:Icc-related predicted phosphoesterase